MVPNPRISETQDDVPSLLDTVEEKPLLKESIESLSKEKNETDDSSKPIKSESTVNEEFVPNDGIMKEEASSDSTHYMVRDEDDDGDDDDKVEAEKKIPPAIEKNFKTESAAKAMDENTFQEAEDDDGLDDEMDDDDDDDDEEEDIKVVKVVEVPARRSRRACSTVVTYKIDDSDSEYEDESDKENDSQEDDDYKDDCQDEDDDDDEEDDVIEIESDLSEEASDFDASQVDEESGSEDEGKPKAQESPIKQEANDSVQASDEFEEEEKKEEETPSGGGKKRKKAPAKVTKNVKKEEGPPKKKPRVSEAVIQDAADKMLAVLIQQYMDGIKEVPLDELASSVTNKRGKPYTNHRSDAIVEGLKRLKAQDQAEKIKYKSTGAAKLTQFEIDKIPKEEISSDPKKVLEQRFAQFLERLSRHKKGGKGEKIVGAANAVWNKLLDGKAYTSKQLVAATEYTGTNSSGFEAIMVTLKKTDFVQAKGKSKYAFTDKVFPHGRP